MLYTENNTQIVYEASSVTWNKTFKWLISITLY